MAESHFVRRCTCKDFIVAREGMEQRIVPTGMATRGNEIERHRNFSEKHFSGVAACGFRLVGHGGGAVWDGAVPVYVTRFGDWREHDLIFSDKTEAGQKSGFYIFVIDKVCCSNKYRMEDYGVEDHRKKVAIYARMGNEEQLTPEMNAKKLEQEFENYCERLKSQAVGTYIPHHQSGRNKRSR